MLYIEHLTKTFGEKKAVDDLSLHIAPGEIYGFIGHNGAGKTTTLKSVVGIQQFDSGRITIGGQSIHSDDPALSELLANIYSSRERPLCLCRTPGIEMYVAKVDEKYLIKRMPNYGSGHAPACDSYEPPPELSGLGQVIGSAIQENPDEGTTALKFDFALSKGASRSAPAPTSPRRPPTSSS